jgi:hypothetical protein
MNDHADVLLIGRDSSCPVSRALERAGFRVTSAPGTIYGVAAAAPSRAVSAIVLDGYGSRSFDLVTYLRHRFPEAPLVFLGRSGADLVERTRGGLAATTVCLPEPIDPSLVASAVGTTVSWMQLTRRSGTS